MFHAGSRSKLQNSRTFSSLMNYMTWNRFFPQESAPQHLATLIQKISRCWVLLVQVVLTCISNASESRALLISRQNQNLSSRWFMAAITPPSESEWENWISKSNGNPVSQVEWEVGSGPCKTKGTDMIGSTPNPNPHPIIRNFTKVKVSSLIPSNQISVKSHLFDVC